MRKIHSKQSQKAKSIRKQRIQRDVSVEMITFGDRVQKEIDKKSIIKIEESDSLIEIDVVNPSPVIPTIVLRGPHPAVHPTRTQKKARAKNQGAFAKKLFDQINDRFTQLNEIIEDLEVPQAEYTMNMIEAIEKVNQKFVSKEAPVVQELRRALDMELQGDDRCVTEVVDEDMKGEVVKEYLKVDVMKYLIEVRRMACVERGRIHLMLKQSENYLGDMVSDQEIRDFKKLNMEQIQRYGIKIALPLNSYFTFLQFHKEAVDYFQRIGKLNLKKWKKYIISESSGRYNRGGKIYGYVWQNQTLQVKNFFKTLSINQKQKEFKELKAKFESIQHCSQLFKNVPTIIQKSIPSENFRQKQIQKANCVQKQKSKSASKLLSKRKAPDDSFCGICKRSITGTSQVKATVRNRFQQHARKSHVIEYQEVQSVGFKRQRLTFQQAFSQLISKRRESQSIDQIQESKSQVNNAQQEDLNKRSIQISSITLEKINKIQKRNCSQDEGQAKKGENKEVKCTVMEKVKTQSVQKTHQKIALKVIKQNTKHEPKKLDVIGQQTKIEKTSISSQKIVVGELDQQLKNFYCKTCKQTIQSSKSVKKYSLQRLVNTHNYAKHGKNVVYQKKFTFHCDVCDQQIKTSSLCVKSAKANHKYQHHHKNVKKKILNEERTLRITSVKEHPLEEPKKALKAMSYFCQDCKKPYKCRGSIPKYISVMRNNHKQYCNKKLSCRVDDKSKKIRKLSKDPRSPIIQEKLKFEKLDQKNHECLICKKKFKLLIEKDDHQNICDLYI